jgi:hypothetical protein
MMMVIEQKPWQCDNLNAPSFFTHISRRNRKWNKQGEKKGKIESKALHWKVGIKKLKHQRESLPGREQWDVMCNKRNQNLKP